MKLTLTLVLLLSASTARADGNVFLHTGSPVTSSIYSAHLNGQEISVTEFVSALHEMNLPDGRQPVDLWIHFPVIADPSSDHLAFCQAAFDKVQTDQQNMKSGDRFRPFLQITIDPTLQQLTTDEGTPAYQERAVNCWEVADPLTHP